MQAFENHMLSHGTDDLFKYMAKIEAPKTSLRQWYSHYWGYYKFAFYLGCYLCPCTYLIDDFDILWNNDDDCVQADYLLSANGPLGGNAHKKWEKFFCKELSNTPFETFKKVKDCEIQARPATIAA